MGYHARVSQFAHRLGVKRNRCAVVFMRRRIASRMFVMAQVGVEVVG